MTTQVPRNAKGAPPPRQEPAPHSSNDQLNNQTEYHFITNSRCHPYYIAGPGSTDLPVIVWWSA